MANKSHMKSEREYLRQAIIRGFIIVIAATCMAIILTLFTISDLPAEIQQRALLTALVLPVVIAPPAIVYTTRQEVLNYRLMLKINAMAHTDEMTGLANRRAFMQEAAQRLDVHDFAANSLSIMILDVDHFKRVNDEYGHAVGDMALKHIANTLYKVMPRSAIVSRLGGEEFAVACTFEDLPDLNDIADKLRRSVATAPLPHEDGQSISMTISIGVGIAYPGDSVSALLSRADVALYDAKNEGRDRFAIAA